MPFQNRHYSPWLSPLRPRSGTGKQPSPGPHGGPAEADVVMMTVKAVGDVVVYDTMGNTIPGDRFVAVPVSSGTVFAVLQGDLEEATTVADEPARATKPASYPSP